MQKLIKWFKHLDQELVHYSVLAYIVIIALFPKIPITHVTYTYIRIRFDDLFPAILSAIFVIQLLRKKVSFNTRLLKPILLFWVLVFISYGIGYYVQHTIPWENKFVGLLHSLRRVQYMFPFFVASSVIISEKRFFQYMKWYLTLVFIVCVYGLGQKFLRFPSIQSMNPAYVDGRLLFLNPEDRINSTFGGHFDLAAYLTLAIPVILGFYLWTKKKWYFATFILALTSLLYTSARSSFLAYLMSTTAFLLYLKKFRVFAVVIGLTVVLLLITGDMTERFLQTIQLKTVYLNTQTGSERIDQKISVDRLPAGGYEIPLFSKRTARNVKNVDQERLRQIALEEAMREAQEKGLRLSADQLNARTDQIAKFIKPQQTLLCDISCATRLQVEWPRAISAFLYGRNTTTQLDPVSILIGSGPSALGEATDNDILRWLGELGVLGTSVFVFILLSVLNAARFIATKVEKNQKYVFIGFIFGIIAVVLNAIYVDIFEASKVAYHFWIIAGFLVGLKALYEKRSSTR